MFKLKLLLFLSKFSKYFREMAENELIKKIEDEIFIYLTSDVKYNDFKFLKLTPLPNATGYMVNISIEYHGIDFSFSLEYSGVDALEKQYKIDIRNSDELVLLSILDYYKYFKKIQCHNLIKNLKRLNSIKNQNSAC